MGTVEKVMHTVPHLYVIGRQMHDRDAGLPQKELNVPFPQPSWEQTLAFDATRYIFKLPIFSDNSGTEM